MSKYDGIEKPEAVLAEAESVREPEPVKKQKKGGYFKSFFIRVSVAGIIIAALFGLKFAPLEFSATVTDTVKNAVTYDLIGGEQPGEYLTDKLLKLFGQPDEKE